MTPRQICILIARQIVALWLLALPTASCLGQGVTEGELKASYLVNFLKYIEWPESQASLHIRTLCYYGLDNVGSYLAAYEGRIIHGRELRLRRLTASDTFEGCHELYIPALAEERIETILRSTANLPILTVSDAEAFAHHGGAIALIRAEGRFQFDINTGALSRAGIKASSPLLRLARQIVGAPK